MKNWIGSLKEKTSYRALTSVWIISHLCVMATIVPMLIIFPEHNVILLEIQIISAVIILLGQRFSYYRMFQKCAECGRERVFHNRKKYPEFKSIICDKFKNHKEDSWHV